MSCNYEPYVLPQIDFIGGETQDLQFNMYYYANNEPFDLTGCEARFSVLEFAYRNSPVIQKDMTTVAENADNNLLRVTLLPKDTVNLFGKYIYQISIKDADGEIEIPKQGILMIYNNIDKDFIS